MVLVSCISSVFTGGTLVVLCEISVSKISDNSKGHAMHFENLRNHGCFPENSPKFLQRLLQTFGLCLNQKMEKNK